MKTATSVTNGEFSREGEKVPKESTGVFVQHVNPMTSRSEWRMQAEDYDYQQEVARAAFADMLHDSERVSLDLLQVEKGRCSVLVQSRLFITIKIYLFLRSIIFSKTIPWNPQNMININKIT